MATCCMVLPETEHIMPFSINSDMLPEPDWVSAPTGPNILNLGGSYTAPVVAGVFTVLSNFLIFIGFTDKNGQHMPIIVFIAHEPFGIKVFLRMSLKIKKNSLYYDFQRGRLSDHDYRR